MTSLPTGKLGKLTPPSPLENPIPSVGGGVWIFSGTTDSHKCSVEQLFNKMSFDRQILLAIQFIESLNVCLGFPLKESERVVTMVPHRTGVLESMTDGLQGKKVCTQNCLVLTSSPSNTCQNCLRVQSADKKCRKRKANSETLSPYCNKQGVTNRWNQWSENQSINQWQSMPINRLISIIDEQSMLGFYVIIDFIDYQFLSIINANRSVNCHRLVFIFYAFYFQSRFPKTRSLYAF